MGTLGEREIEILGLISEGLSNREVAERLCLSVNTVKWYNQQLFAKLGVKSRTQALNVARRYSLIPPQPRTREEKRPFPRNNLPVQWTSYVGRRVVDLFLQRARTAHPRIEIDGADIVAAGRICLRLDGLPLAIELAASQAKVYPLPRLAELLEQGLGALPDGPRDLPARQRTLRATIEWSTNPLRENERRLLARLAVFHGGATLEAVQAVCAPRLDGDVADLLLSLVDKSLVVAGEGAGGEPRFGMLETIHEFAEELLAAGGEREVIRTRHADYVMRLAEQFSHEVRGAGQGAWHARLQAERANLSAALSWSLAAPDPGTGLRLAAALMEHWYYNGTLEDARWAELALEKAADAQPALRAAVARSVGTLYHNLGDMPRVAALHRQAAELFRQVGDERNAAWSLMFVSIAGSENLDQIDACLATTQRSLATLRRLGDRPGMATALSALGELWRMKGDYDAAGACYAESLALSQDTGERIRQAVQYVNLGFVAYHQGEHALAIDQIRHSLAIMDELEIVPGVLTGLYVLAGPVAALGSPAGAARLIGAADAGQELTDAQLRPSDRRDVVRIVDSIREALGAERYEQEWQAGHEMSTRQAIAVALGEGV